MFAGGPPAEKLTEAMGPATVVSKMTLAVISLAILFVNAEATNSLSSSPVNANKLSFASNTNSSNNNNNLYSGGSNKPGNPYNGHRFKGLDRILNRLDGLGVSRGMGTTSGKNEDNSKVNNYSVDYC